jgi:hypothetical protein
MSLMDLLRQDPDVDELHGVARRPPVGGRNEEPRDDVADAYRRAIAGDVHGRTVDSTTGTALTLVQNTSAAPVVRRALSFAPYPRMPWNQPSSHPGRYTAYRRGRNAAGANCARRGPLEDFTFFK